MKIAFAVGSDISGHAENLGVRLTEHFSVAYTSRSIAVTSLNEIPEILRYVVIIWFGISAIASERTDNHRNVLIGMACADIIYIA